MGCRQEVVSHTFSRKKKKKKKTTGFAVAVVCASLAMLGLAAGPVRGPAPAHPRRTGRCGDRRRVFIAGAGRGTVTDATRTRSTSSWDWEKPGRLRVVEIAVHG